MKTLFPHTSKNRFPLLLLIAAVLFTGMVLWFIRHISGGSEQLFVLNSVWLAAAIILILAVFLAACLMKIHALQKSHQTLLINNAERKRTEETLRESEARYRIVTESASDAILTIDREHTILFVNPAAEKIFGYTIDEMLGSKLFMLMPERLRGAHAAGMARYAKTNARNIPWKGVEVPALHKDGYEFPIEITFGEINHNGRHLFTAVMRDITTRKQAEETLRESEANLARAQRITHLGSWQLDLSNLEDLNQNAVRWSDEVFRIFGYEPEQCEVSNEFFYSCVHPDDRTRIAETLADAINQRKIFNIEHRAVLPNGEERVVYGQAELVCDDATGKPLKMVGTVQDITERKRADAALRESEFKLRTLIESTSEGIVQVDTNEKIEFVNDSFCEMIGYSREELIGKITLDIFFDDEGLKLVAKANRERPKGVSSRYEVYLKTKSGEKLWVVICGAPIMDGAGKLVGTMAVFTNMTERKRAETALRESEYKLRTLIEKMSEGLLQVDNGDSIQFVNNYFCEMLGYSPDELIGKVWSELMLDDEGREFIKKVNRRRREGISDRYELRLRRKTGETIWALIGGVPLFDVGDRVSGSLGIFTDITDRKRAEEQLLHDAFHDALTGLANRAFFMNHLRLTNDRNRRRKDSRFAVLFLDFDRFKIVNDSLGHTEGDNLLKMIAERLSASVRPGDLVARLGGDEFIILLSEMLEANDAVQVAERIQDDLKNPFDLNGNEVLISVSIGIALSTTESKRAEDMLRDADIAMYRAKAEGRARYRIFDQSLHARATSRLQLETEMRQALERGEFELHYQPIINLAANELTGFEALVRWRHPKKGMIPPGDFIPAAEETGLILPLGRWILDESCRQLREWQNAYPLASSLYVSVNLSCKQFLQSDLAEQVAETLAATELAPRCLILEITESYLIENSEKAIKIMNRLRSLGVELSLDDFGTGYSSLSYLHRLPVSNLKIDRSFVSRMTESEENSEIVRTIIKLAQNLKMKTIAEGIETAAQLAQLDKLNCGCGQGYFFSKPLEAEKAAIFINEKTRNLPCLTGQPTINLELDM